LTVHEAAGSASGPAPALRVPEIQLPGVEVEVQCGVGVDILKRHDGLEERVPSVGKGGCNLPVVLELGLMGVIMSGSIK
jgi:hypothetical protein